MLKSFKFISPLINLQSIPYNDKAKKKDFRIFCKFIKKEKLKYHTDVSIQTLYSVEAPLAAITALSLLGYDVTSFAHLDLGISCHSSPSGWMGAVSGLPFLDLSRDVQSGLWLGR